MGVVYERSKDVHVRRRIVYVNEDKLYNDSDFTYLTDKDSIFDMCLYGTLTVCDQGVYSHIVGFSKKSIFGILDGKLKQWIFDKDPVDIPTITFEDKDNSGYLYYFSESNKITVSDDGHGNLEVTESE